MGSPQGSVLGPLLFLLYINDHPNALSHNASPILFADDTSIIITGHNVQTFQGELNATFGLISKWFQLTSLSLNNDKTHFIQFSSKNLNHETHVSDGFNCISNVNETKFLGININNTLSWNSHIERILPKLCSACFAMRSLKPFVSMTKLCIFCRSYVKMYPIRYLFSIYIYIISNMTNSISYRLPKTLYGFTECE
jgi:hypothetical protein